MRLTIVLIAVTFISLMPNSVISDQVAVLQPGGIVNQNDYEILSWRTRLEPTVNFSFFSAGDSLAVWFKPLAACSLVAIRFYAKDIMVKTLFDVWDGSRYDGHITTTDSTDSSGWIGQYEDGEWIPGPVMGYSPIGWDAQYPSHHYWGPFPLNILEYMHEKWFEIPAEYGLQGETDLGEKPFFVTIIFYPLGGGGMAAEDEGTTPYHFFQYYAQDTGPDGIHNGWFLRRHSIWIEAVVKYYEPISGPHVIVVDYEIDDDMSGESRGNGDGFINPGETIELSLQLTNTGGTVDTNITSLLKTEDEYITIIDSLGTFGDIAPDDTVRSSDDFVFELSPEFSITPQIDFALTLMGSTGETRHLFFTLPGSHIESETVLLVLRDWSTFHYLYYTEVLNSLGISYITWQGSPELDILSKYNTIIWSTGSKEENTLTSSDQSNLQTWLSNGGNLFLSGQLIGVDIGDTPFYSDYLHCTHVYSPAGLHHLKSTATNPVFGELDIVLSSEGENQQSFASEIYSYSPAFPILQYDTSTPEGSGNIQLNGTAAVAVGKKSYKAVYFAFGFEGIDSFADRLTLMHGIFNWFGDHPTNVDEDENDLRLIPNRSFLFQNYPNPFNAETDIRYQIVDNRYPYPISLKIYNILGQEVKTLVNAEQGLGQYVVTWDGKDDRGNNVSSGIYFYDFSIGKNTKQTRKMMLLR